MKRFESEEITPAMKIKVLIDEAMDVKKRIEYLENESNDDNLKHEIDIDLLNLAKYYLTLCQRIGQYIVKYGVVLDASDDIQVIEDEWEFK